MINTCVWREFTNRDAENKLPPNTVLFHKSTGDLYLLYNPIVEVGEFTRDYFVLSNFVPLDKVTMKPTGGSPELKDSFYFTEYKILTHKQRSFSIKTAVIY